MWILLWLDEVVYELHPGDGWWSLVQHVLTDSPPAGYVHFCKRGGEVSYYDSGLNYFSSQF